jgi:hypothetical protein
MNNSTYFSTLITDRKLNDHGATQTVFHQQGKAVLPHPRSVLRHPGHPADSFPDFHLIMSDGLRDYCRYLPGKPVLKFSGKYLISICRLYLDLLPAFHRYVYIR